MKLTLKTVAGKQFQVDAEAEETVDQIKQKVQDVQGNALPKERQVLIFQGKILKDDTTLADNGVTENGFLVVMANKAKTTASQPAPEATPKTTASPTTPATTSGGQQVSEGEPKAPKEEPKPPEKPAQAAEEAAPTPASAEEDYTSAASHLVTGTELEATVKNIVEMGFPEDQVKQAMRAAFNNPDRAVEYLMTGIPATETAAVSNPQPRSATEGGAPEGGAPTAQPFDMFQQGGQGATGEEGEAGEGALDFLRDNQQFQALRTMVQANPQILQPMLQELGKQNPRLLDLINSNQQEFLQLLNEPLPEGASAEQLMEGLMGEGAEGEGLGATEIQITPEENEAIQRLEAMGFDRALVIQAFFACDKDEALAANFLLEHGNDME